MKNPSKSIETMVNEKMIEHNITNQRLKSFIIKLCNNQAMIVTEYQIEEWLLSEQKKHIPKKGVKK